MWKYIQVLNTIDVKVIEAREGSSTMPIITVVSSTSGVHYFAFSTLSPREAGFLVEHGNTGILMFTGNSVRASITFRGLNLGLELGLGLWSMVRVEV